MTRSLLLLPLLFLGARLLPAQEPFSEEDFQRNARQVVPRDAFPVLTDPEMVDVRRASEELRDDEPVIGLVLNGEARAWPISVMGSHELVNDRIGGIPIAVSW